MLLDLGRILACGTMVRLSGCATGPKDRNEEILQDDYNLFFA